MENDESKKLDHSSTLNGNGKDSTIELKVVRAESYSQLEAEGELRMLVKKKVIETWDKLNYWLSVYLEETRKGGGTMGHKVGSLRDQQKQLKELFEKL